MPTQAPQPLQPLQHSLLHLLAAAASPRPRTWLFQQLPFLHIRNEAGRRATQEDVRLALQDLVARGWLHENSPRGPGYFQVVPERGVAVYHDLLTHGSPVELQQLLRRDAGLEGPDGRGLMLRPFPNHETAVAITRLELFMGAAPAQVARLRQSVGWSGDWDRIFEQAVFPLSTPQMVQRLHPSLQGTVLTSALAALRGHWVRATGFDTPVLIAATQAWLKTHAGIDLSSGQMPAAVDAAQGSNPLLMLNLLAEVLLLTGDAEALQACLNAMIELSSPGATSALGERPDEQAEFALMARLLRALDDGLDGRWAAAQEGFESVAPVLRKLTQRRKGLLPDTLATPYVLALLAQGGNARWLQALKFCRAEGGKGSGEPDASWTVMALALQMRLGEVPREPQRLRLYSRAPRAFALDWWSWLMRAWLAERDDARHPAHRLTADDEHAYETLRAHLLELGLKRPLAQLEAAHAVLHEQTPAIPFFVPPPQEGWQVALAALASIASTAAEPSAKGSADSTPARLWWVLDVDDQGVLRAITPFEQKQGARGWGKPKEAPLARLVKAAGLADVDVAVARCIQAVAHERRHRIDLPAALVALIGHPHVAFDDAPERAVQLVEAAPELEVVDHGPDLLVRLKPPPVLDDPDDDAVTFTTEEGFEVVVGRRHITATERKEREALRYLRVLRDEPQRARLVRYTPAQRQVAQLVSLGLTIPRAASSQLQAVVASLGAHVQIQGDQLQAAREVPPDSRLRAELTPGTAAGPEGLTLRLVVAPLGPEGPRLPPGSGRARLIARVAGDTLGVQRDLAAERSHLDTTLEACPMLGPLPPARHEGQVVPAVWDIESPEAALALVERLHSLQAVAALDWPKGQPIRVDTAGLPQLKVQVQSGTEWLALDGAVTVDESLVVTLSRLLDWSASSRSRFVALGEGRYLALTEELRTRLDELQAVGEVGPGAGAGRSGPVQVPGGRTPPGRWGSSGAAWRVPSVAAAWLAQTLEGTGLQTDDAWQDRLERLVQAQQAQAEVPSTLQAELRPYQVEGYRWMMRLAEAGLGAVLADDMGLGKTLQATAVLLARAAGGAALVVAPTSLIGNWADELRRFAPSLTVHAFAEGDRESLVAHTGPGEVVLITYQLLWLHAATLVARRWHTLVLDEAQSIKNAAAKRSQAAFDLQADFRIALSGTPIENRLAELWAIMRVCNPGLLGTAAQFQSRFALPIERDRQTPPRRILRRLIAPFVMRRTKAQVLDDLPPRTELVLRVKGNDTELAHYEALRRQAVVESQEALSGQAVGQAHFNILAQLTRLRRAACDPRLVTPDLQQPGAKVQAFGELAAELVANGHKALVFSQFVDFLKLLREPLDAAGIAYQYLDGSTPAAERQSRVAAFQAGQGHLFLISLKAGGFGLNLTVADYVVIADPWWNPAAEDQASGRAHRIGQQRPVTVYRLVNSGTLEDRIVEMHDTKRALSDAVLKADDEGATLGPLKADELLALMRAEPSGEGR